MTSPSCECRFLLVFIFFSCLKIYKCDDMVQSCCQPGYVLGLARDKSVQCVESGYSNTRFNLGPKNTNFSSWEKCNYELQPIIRMNDKKELFCVNELTFIDEDASVMPYLAGIQCKNDTVQKNSIMHGVNKCCKMGQMFATNHCAPLKSGMTNVIDQEINQGTMYAAVNLYNLFFGNGAFWKWSSKIRVYEKPISYFTSLEYISEFPKGHPGEYCIEQSENASNIIVVTDAECLNCAPQCYGYDKYITKVPDSEDKFVTRSIVWNQYDTYEYMKKFERLYWTKIFFSQTSVNNECTKGLNKYKTYSEKIRGQNVFFPPYSHKYDTDICYSVYIDENFEGHTELFSCRNSFENWTLFKQIIFTLGFTCTILTFLVFAFLPSLRNMFGKSMMVYLVCCMGLNVMYMASLFEINAIQSWYYRGFLKYFFDISKSFWMLLMSFDIWITARKINVGNKLASASPEGLKFFGYCFLSFTTSIILTIYLIIDEHRVFHKKIRVYKTEPELLLQDDPDIIDHDNKRTNEKYLLFYVIPTLCFVIMNLVFYALTLVAIYCIKNKNGAFINLPADRCFNCFKKFQYQLGLIVKLFCAMGLVWIFNIPALIINYLEIDQESKYMDIIHVLSELSSFLEGIFIFFIFVVKKRNIQQLRERLKAQ